MATVVRKINWREVLAFTYATLSVVLVVVVTLRYSIVGLVGSVLALAGFTYLMLEAEKALNRFAARLEQSFECQLLMARFAFRRTLKRLQSDDYDKAKFAARLRRACQEAVEQEKEWKVIVSLDENLWLSEVNTLVDFEEEFLRYTEALAESEHTADAVYWLEQAEKAVKAFGRYSLELALAVEI